MPAFALIADRFFQLTDGRIVDLASGLEVWVRTEPAGGGGRDWVDRCAALYGRRHAHLVELVDYGALGRSGRFEAFGTRGPARRWPAGDASRSALKRCAAFLVREGLSPGPCDLSRVIDVEGTPRLLPDGRTGLVLGREKPAVTKSVVEGIVIQPRSAVGQVTEFLDKCWSHGPRGLQIRAPAGAGASVTLHLVAREARLRGLVPVITTLFERHRAFADDDEPRRWLLNELVGRHVVLLHDRGNEPAAEQTTLVARALLSLALPRLHVAVVSVSDRAPASSSVVLEPLPPEQLLAMLGHARGSDHGRARVMRAVRASHGWPGRFARALGVSEEGCRQVAVARERAPKFGVSNDLYTLDLSRAAGADLDGWKRLIEARRLAARGRHAAAVRTFRQAIGMCDRRGDQLHAGTAGNELGHLLLMRGGADAAREVFEAAGRRLRQSGGLARALVSAAGEGLARMEMGELKEAETILRTSDLAAYHLNALPEGLMIRTALLRCLYYRARWDEAGGMIQRENPSLLPEAAESNDSNCEDRVMAVSAAAEESAELSRPAPVEWVHWHGVAATIAMARRALDEAARHVAAAMTASADGPPLATCAAHAVAVRLHGWIGDVEAVRVHAARGLQAARAGRAPIEALRLRVNLVEALEQAGAGGEARALALRLMRIRPSRIPALPRAELTIVLARLLPHHAEARSRRSEAEAFARSAGATALLCTPASGQSLPKPLCDIVDVVRSTHEYADEQEWLQRAAELLRSRLQAMNVAFVPAQDAGGVVVSVGTTRGVGGRRAIETGILIGPVRTTAGVEMAVPIRCGNATIGALECRWSATGPDNGEQARALVVATAAVSGPFLRSVVERRIGRPGPDSCPELLGVSPGMADLRQAVARAAAAPFPVLIVGESGVGKELVARAVHRESPRRLRNFATLNCAALTEELAESELFGHARGAFTGAMAERRGLFEEADGGTLFLDEVSELSWRAQAKLLRVLQEGEVRRVGESFARHVEVRVVAATNRSLDALAAERLFRHDLRYRLDVIRIEVPPLRQRIEDIPVLARAFWTRAAPLAGCRASLSSAALAALARYDWPGNVRELQNVVSALIVAAPRHGMVGLSALPISVAQAATVLTATTLDEARQAFERRFVMAALARAGGRSSRAAKELGITRQGLAKLLKRLGVADGVGIQSTECRIQKAESRE